MTHRLHPHPRRHRRWRWDRERRRPLTACQMTLLSAIIGARSSCSNSIIADASAPNAVAVFVSVVGMLSANALYGSN
jgi:hypothetical protein